MRGPVIPPQPQGWDGNNAATPPTSPQFIDHEGFNPPQVDFNQ